MSLSNVSIDQFSRCQSVSTLCPVEATIISYRPALVASALFLTIFGACLFVQLGLGIRYRTWSFMTALVIGCLLEIIGYIGRVMLYHNAWNTQGYTIQIICLIIAPAFIAAGVYLTLKHLVLVFGEQFSIISARLYTWIFIGADIISLIVQAVGAATSATGKDPNILKVGTYVALAGIVFQVVSLLAFAVLAQRYFQQVWQQRKAVSKSASELAMAKGFRFFVAAVVVAYLTVLIRCCYRIPELAEGWRSKFMRNEVAFTVLDGAMMAIASLVLTVCHPGYCFPQFHSRFREHSKV